MKKSYQRWLLFFFLISCSNRDQKNPVDPNTTSNVGQVSQVCIKSLSEKMLEISWKPAKNSIGVKIFKKQLEGNVFESLVEMPSDSTHYIDRIVELNRTYIYKLTSFNNRSESTIELSFHHNFLAPTNLTIEQISSTILLLKWDDNSTFENGFSIERKIISSNNYIRVGTVEKDQHSFFDDTVELGKKYIYRVIAFTDFTRSSSDSAMFNNIIYCPDSLSAQQISENEIEVKWIDRCNFEDKYMIERADCDIGEFKNIGYVSMNTTSFSDVNVSIGKCYLYRVQTSAVDQLSEYSNSILIQHVFASPTNLKSTHLDSTSVLLEWVDRSSIENSFEIEQKVNDGGWYTKGVVDANITSFSSRGLSNRNLYSYRVKAKGITYRSEPTNEVKINYSATWIKQDTGDISRNYRCIHFPSKNVGYIGGEGGMIKTIDGGETWREVKSVKGFYRFEDIHFVNELDGWAVGYQHDPLYVLADVVAKTENGGDTWVKMPLAQISSYSHYSASPNCVFAFDKRTAIIAGLWKRGLDDNYSVHGFFAKTTNSGEDWNFTFQEIFYIPNDLQFFNSTRGLATCSNNRFITKDGGRTWINQFDGYVSYTGGSSICLINPNLAWTVDNFQLLKSIDGGETWQTSWNGGEGNPQYVFFIDANNGWAISNNLIFNTADGGNNWQKMRGPTGLKIRCLYFTEKSKGWAAGDAGIVLRTKSQWMELN